MCFTFVLSVVFPDVVTEANGINSENDYYTKIDVDTYRQAATFPEKEGYVFAGWYQDAEFKNAVSGATPGDGAYAKFLDSTVLSVKCQLKKGTTLDSKSTDLRLITSVDSLDYQTVGFDLEVNGKTASITSKTVYQTIYGYVNDASESYTPGDVFSQTDSRYFMTKNVTNIPQSAFETDILATPFWITLDGTKVTGTARTVKIGDKLFTPDSLGFVAGTGTTMTQEMKDGETVVKADLEENSQIYFDNVIAEAGTKGHFFTQGYQYVTFDMYIESSANFLFNTSTHNIWTNGNGYDWSEEQINTQVNLKKGEFLRTYKDGVRDPIKQKVWYTVSMKVENYSNNVSIQANGGPATIYLKNLVFSNAFPAEKGQPDSLGFKLVDASTGSSVVKVTEGDFANTMKFTASGSGSEWDNYNRVTFEGIEVNGTTITVLHLRALTVQTRPGYSMIMNGPE